MDMRNWIVTIVLSFACLSLNGQSTWSSVYNVLNTNCATSGCHDSNAQGGLDFTVNANTLYGQLFNQPPNNTFAAAKGYSLVEEGVAQRSFLFRKMHHSLDFSVDLDPSEGLSMPPSGAIPAHDIELVRQWILNGAPQNGNVVDQALIQDYYSGNGIPSITTAPPKPLPSEGFQTHFGPFFLDSFEEDEFFWRYDTKIPNDLELYKIEVFMGDYSHHFILYEFNDENTNAPYGLRGGADFGGTKVVAAWQNSDPIQLPDCTAFHWDAGTVMDFNSHYINFSSAGILASEVYVNFYTQPAGTAMHIMETSLDTNLFLFIPNNGNPYDFTNSIVPGGSGTRYLWGITSHTHQWGTDYNIFMRDANGNQGAQIFDAEYLDGDPNGIYIGYDYQHPPTRYFLPYLPIKNNEGLLQEAHYVNNGPSAVTFGLESDDEMMLSISYFLNDTTGLAACAGTSAPSAQANFTSSTNAICEGDEISFTDASTNADNLSWDFGDGNTSTDANPTHTYLTPGTFTVTLTASNASGSSVFTDYILVNAAPAVSISGLPSTTSSSSPIAIAGSPSGGSFSGTGVVFNAFNPTLAGPGIHPITYSYTDYNGCSAETTASILVISLSFNFVSYNLGTISPKNDELLVEVETLETGTHSYEIYNVDGKLMLDGLFEMDANKQQIVFDLPELSEGIFYLQIANKNGDKISKSFLR